MFFYRMGWRSELSHEVRAQIVALHNEGLLFRAIASRLQCHHTTVVRTIKRHAEQKTSEADPEEDQPRLLHVSGEQ